MGELDHSRESLLCTCYVHFILADLLNKSLPILNSLLPLLYLTTLQDSLNHRLQLWLNKVDRQGISLSNYTYLLLFEAIHCGWMLLCNFPWGMAVSCYRNKARCEFVHESRCGAWYTQLPLHEPQHISLPDLQAAVLLWEWMKYCLFNLYWWY